MNKPQTSQDQVDAIEKDLKYRHGGKLPYVFIAVFAMVCAGINVVSPADAYGGHFMRLAFFGWFCWIICRKLESVARQWKGKTADGADGPVT